MTARGKERRLIREDIAGPQGAASRPMWETLEGMVREKAQEFIQQIMEEEVTELLGREKSECRSNELPGAVHVWLDRHISRALKPTAPQINTPMEGL